MDVNEITITMDSNWYIDRSTRQKIGYSGENAVVEFKLDATPEDGFTYYLDVQSKKVKNAILLDDELTVTLTSEMLGEAGIKKMQIRAYSDEQVKKSNIFEVEVGESINAVEEVENHALSAFNQLATLIGTKQDTLTAGEGITITGNIISVSYPDGDVEVY